MASASSSLESRHGAEILLDFQRPTVARSRALAAERSLTLRIGMVVVAVSITPSDHVLRHVSTGEVNRATDFRWNKSYKGHMVDALAAGGDEGRRSLR